LPHGSPQPAALAVPPPSTAAASPATEALHGFEAWVAQFVANPDPAKRANLIAEGLALARERRAALKQLIQDDPAKALASALPFRLRQALPPEFAPLLETRISAQAPLTVVYAKPPDGQPCTGQTTLRFARIGDTFYYIHAYGRRQIAFSQPSAILMGVAVDDQLALSEDPFRILDADETQALRKDGALQGQVCPVCGESLERSLAPAVLDAGGHTVALCDSGEVPAYFQTPDGSWIWAGGGTGGTGIPSPVNPATRTQGELRFLFMRCRFADDSATYEPSTDARVRQDLDAVMRTYAEMSYGTLQGRYAFTPTLTLPKPRSGYMNGWSDVDGMTALLNDAKALAAQIVENGAHPYDPANFDDFAARWNGEPGGCCSYGGGGNTWIRWDGPDVLVHEWGHAIGLPHANFWNPATDDPIGPGAHEEYGNTFDAMGNGGSRHFSAMFKAQLNWIPVTNYWTITTNGTYRIYAHDQGTRMTANRYAARISRIAHEDFAYWLEYRANTLSGTDESMWTNGVTVTRDLSGHILDMTPGTSRGRDDSPLPLGRTYSDLRAGIHITPIARGVSGQPYVDVAVTFDGGSPNSAPVCVITTSTATPTGGLPVQLNCFSSEPDRDSMAYSWDFGDGTSSINNLPSQTKTYSATGVYVVRCTVSDLRGGRCIDSLTLKVGSPAEYTVAGRVTTPDGRPIANAMIRDGNGRLGYSGTDGTYTLGRLPAGTHILTAVRDGADLSPAYRAATVPSNLNGMDFVAATPLESGHGLRREHWLNLTGSTLANLTSSSRYPASPDGSQIVADAFEGPVDWAENYGARYRGYFIPPLSGGYVFYIASDDASELRLSRDANTNGATRIAYVSGYTSERAWTANTTQKSTLLQLAAGQRYYIEALHKEGGGGDHLAVGVDLPDGSQSRPAAARFFEPFISPPLTEPVLVNVTTPTPLISEGDSAPGQFLFTRTGPTNSALRIQFFLRGTAGYGADYTATGLIADIPAGTASVSVPIAPANDTTTEFPESVIATVVAGPGYVPGPANTASLTLQDNDGTTTVSILATAPVASRVGPTPGRFTVRRTGTATSPVSVSLSIGGTAVAGTDYSPLPNPILFPAGVTAVELEILPTPLPGFGLTKTVLVTVGSGSGYSVVSPTSASCSIAHPGPGFGVLRESWTDVNGGTVSALTNDARFPGSPSSKNYLTTVFEGPHDAADNYGARYTATFVAPATGSYYFSIASDDGGELWLGTNALASSRRRIAYVTGSVGFRAWTAQSTQRSAAQSLVAGRRYYIEALHAEGGGNDHLSVGVQMPGNMSEYPITMQWLEPYSAGQPLLVASAPRPSASEAGRTGQFAIKRTGDPSAALAVTATISGTAQFGLDYTLNPTVGAAPFWVRLARSGSVITGYASPDGTNWTRTGSATFTNLPASLLVGMAVCTRNNNVLSTSVLEQVSLNAPDAPWVSSDVGAVGAAGNTSATDGSFAISATGADINGTADSFHYVYRQISGDVQITAQVMAQGASDPAAKTGLMIRESLVAGARHATVATTPRSHVQFVHRATTSGTSQTLAAPVLIFAPGQSVINLDVIPRADTSLEGVEPVTLTLNPGTGYALGYSDTATVNLEALAPLATLSGGGGSFLEGDPSPVPFMVSLSSASFGPVTVHYELSGSASPADVGPASGTVTIPVGQTSAPVPITVSNDGFLEKPETLGLRLAPGGGYELTSSTSQQVTLLDASTNSLPEPWTWNNLGITGWSGGVATANDGFIVQGAGLGAAGTDDGLVFLSRPIGRDGALTVSLPHQTGDDPLAAAGIMIRDSLAPNATHLFLANTPSRGLVLIDRLTPGGETRERFNTAGLSPVWLRLVRSGDTVQAYRSDDALTWIHAGTSTFTGWPETVQIGMAVTSRNLAAFNEATFRTVVVHHPFTLTAIGNQSASPGTVIGPLAFRFEPETTPASWMRLSAEIDNSPVLGTSGVLFGGSGLARTVQLTPSASQQGVAQIIVHATDGVYEAQAAFSAAWGTAAKLGAAASANGTTLTLSWPDTLGNVILQSTESLAPPVLWSPVDAASTLENGIRRVTLPNNAPARFYRLQLP
jgi:regulation of enolase protein 1 (concanavalin A-like superfamily)